MDRMKDLALKIQNKPEERLKYGEIFYVNHYSYSNYLEIGRS